MKQKMTIAMSLSVVYFLACTSLFSARGDKAEVKGMIISRTGDTLTVKTSSGTVTVALTDETTSGNAIMNEKLSEDRAEAVVGYLVQQV